MKNPNSKLKPANEEKTTTVLCICMREGGGEGGKGGGKERKDRGEEGRREGRGEIEEGRSVLSRMEEPTELRG